MKYTDGSTSTKILAVILAASMVLGIGISALASSDEPETESSVEDYIEFIGTWEDDPATSVEEEYIEAVDDRLGDPAEYKEEPSAGEDEAEDEHIFTDELTVVGETPIDGILPPALTETGDGTMETDALDAPEEEPGEEPIEEGLAEEPAEEPAEFNSHIAADIQFGGLPGALLAQTAPEFAALDDDNRYALIDFWVEDTLQVTSGDILIEKYMSLGLSPEASLVLLLANADSVVAYIKENPGETEAEFLSDFIDAWDLLLSTMDRIGEVDLADATVSQHIYSLISNIYEVMCAAGDADGQFTGINHINDLISSYGEARGTEDAIAFLNVVGNYVYD